MGRSYSVLLLRDDQQVRRFRFNPAWFRLFLFLFFLCALLAAAGIYISYDFWLKNKRLATDVESLRQQVHEKAIKLAGLQNMEKILAVHDPQELQTLLASAQAEAGGMTSSPVVDLQEVFKSVESGVASLKDVALKKLPDDRLRLEFTLTNDKGGKNTLTGYVEAAFITRDGAMLDLPLPQGDLSFHIQRFRGFSGEFSLPTGLALSEVYALRLMVIAEDGQEVFGMAYPIASVLTS